MTNQQNESLVVNPEIEDFQEKELSLTDLGNSERFVRIYRDRVRYSHELRSWFIWNGKYWSKDTSLEIQNLAKEVIRVIYLEASETRDRVMQNKIAAWAKSSHSENRIGAMIDLAKSELPISPKNLDNHDYLLNLNNGVFDLRQGKLLPHDPKYFFTRMVDIDYLENGDCKNWQEFLNLVIPDVNTQRFVQKSIGYSLTGSVDEQCLFFLYGKGANGKSTFIEAVTKLFGDLAQKTDSESLMGYSNGGANPYKARMRGKRFIVSSEIPDGKKWNEVLIKELTGGEMQVARDLYESPYEFRPTFKIWISGNYKPKVEDDSHGFWRRMRIIPFETTIPENQRKPMNKVLESFDFSGILKWAIDGYNLWQLEGLRPPEAVTKATEEYKGEQDILQDFLDEYCTFGDGLRVTKSEFRALFTKYQKDCGYNQDSSPKRLTRALTEKGINTGGNGNGYYVGISVIPRQ